MSSYKQIYYHIIFGTKWRKPTISETHCEELYKYIWGIIKNKNCHLYRINGVADHIHILSDLHPAIALSDYIKDIKLASNQWMKNSRFFSDFAGWQEGYGAFTCSNKDKETIINYIKNQKEHHKVESFYEEYKRLLIEHEIEFDERYLL